MAADLDVQPEFDVRVYSGLCITIPPRGCKRKLQEVEADETVTEPKVGVLLDSSLLFELISWVAFPQGSVE